ncbi:MAG TPA: ABC transporter permease [Candidatus Binatia bacterium]|jgi:putative ABC transport system permease protein|nr:ABC transporter permease [Candidatus Binatia bacterium]
MNLLTELKEGVNISWGAIRSNKLRSILTTLGIVIGVMTVTLMGTAITGLDQAFLQNISIIGADVFYVERFAWFPGSEEDWSKMQKRPPITLAQVNALREQLTLARAVAPVVGMGGPVRYQKRGSDRVQIIGTTDEYLFTSSVGLSEGRFISPGESEGGRPVCIIGSEVATNLFRGAPPLGNRITISGHWFEVIGVLEKQGTFLGMFSLDNQVIIPLRQFVAGYWRDPDYTIQVKAKELEQLETTREELWSVMRKVRHLAPKDPDDFAINQQDQFVKMFHKLGGTIAAVGMFITGLSLFVGGIGIMNIMFVSVAERTREIGIRKAIGAKRRTILLQFLIEAASICLLGGLIGLGIAWPITLAIHRFLPATMSPLVVSIAIGVSLVTGVVAGFLPAWRAARMNPVDALRAGE